VSLDHPVGLILRMTVMDRAGERVRFNFGRVPLAGIGISVLFESLRRSPDHFRVSGLACLTKLQDDNRHR